MKIFLFPKQHRNIGPENNKIYLLTSYFSFYLDLTDLKISKSLRCLYLLKKDVIQNFWRNISAVWNKLCIWLVAASQASDHLGVLSAREFWPDWSEPWWCRATTLARQPIRGWEEMSLQKFWMTSFFCLNSASS